DLIVTGVQTCALPISGRARPARVLPTGDRSPQPDASHCASLARPGWTIPETLYLESMYRTDTSSRYVESRDVATSRSAAVRRHEIGRASCRERVVISV